MKEINERMEEAIQAAGWSIKKMAEACDMPPGTFYNILSGSRKPSFQTLERICQNEPKISAEFLLRGIGQPLKPDSGTDDPCTEYKEHIARQVQESTELLAIKKGQQ